MKPILTLVVCVCLGMVVCVLSPFDSEPKNILTSSAFIESQKVKGQRFHKTGPEHFADYHHAIRMPAREDDKPYETGYKMLALENAKKAVSLRDGEALPWISRGPSNVGGRTRAIWVDPADPTAFTWVVGSAGGGIWKTTDAGLHWSFKTPDLPNLSTSTIHGCLTQPNVLYAGTGEGYSRNMITGNGMYKSMDAGETWSVLESTIGDSRFTNVMRIVVNPLDPDHIIVCTVTNRRSLDGSTNSYIVESLDGGQTWNVQHETNTSRIQQIIADPSFNSLYASFNGDGIYRLQMGDRTWNKVYDADPLQRRMELAMAPSDPLTIYAAIEDGNQSTLIRSVDGGESWTEIQGNFGNWLGGQGWYNNTAAVNPYNPLQVFLGGNSALLTIETNETNSIGVLDAITDGYGAYPQFAVGSKGVHVDHHHITLIPRDDLTQSFYILNGNDGGISFSENSGITFRQTGDGFQRFDDSGNPIFAVSYGYNTSQFYGLDKMNGADRYIGGTQDNGSFYSPEDADETSIWTAAPSGDGFEAVWHYANADLMLESSQFNNVYKSTSRGQSWVFVDLPGFGPFITRLASSNQDPDLVFAVTDMGIARSTDFGSSWELITMPDSWSFGSDPIEISIADPLVIWSGGGLSANRNTFLSTDGGSNFATVNQYPDRDLGILVGISTHPFSKNTAYFTFGAPGAPKVMRTQDLGTTWEDLSGYGEADSVSNNGFPDVVAYSLVVMPHDTNQIWVGTDIGIVESLDGGQSWSLADNDLPALAVYEMKIVNNEVIVATHGQGIWSVELPELDNYELPEPFFVRPGLSVGSFDLLVEGSITAISSLDSSLLSFDLITPDEVIHLEQRFGSKEAGEIDNYAFDLQDKIIGDTILVGRVSIIGYKDALESTASKIVALYNINDNVTEYDNSFDSGQRDIARRGFTIKNILEIEDQSLQTPHFYEPLNTLQAIVQNLIVVSDLDHLLSFDEIVLVEPGESPDPFSPLFYDYASVEASTDKGSTWSTLARYDSQEDIDWLMAYNNSSVDTSLYKRRTINLKDFFDAGDEILIRFILFSDPGAEGWGWSIDNINIVEETVTSSEDLVRSDYRVQIKPNPFDEAVQLRFTLDQISDTRLEVYDMSGKKIVDRVERRLPEGINTQTINLADQPAGSYIGKISAKAGSQFFRLIKL